MPLVEARHLSKYVHWRTIPQMQRRVKWFVICSQKLVKSLNARVSAIWVYSEEMKDLGLSRQKAILLQLHLVMV